MTKFKKTALFALLLLGIPVLTFAQKTLRQKLADEFCAELNKKKFPEVWDESATELLGTAMLPTITAHAEEIKAELGIDLGSENGMKEIGTIIGADAVTSCPKFKSIVEKMMQPKMDEAMAAISLDGRFLGLDTTGKFAFFRVQDSNNREQKIWWMEYFPGSETLENAPKSWVGKSVKVTYVEREVFEPQIKEYIKIKIAVGLSAN